MTQPEQPTQLPSVDEIRSLVEQGQIDEAGLILATFHPADIADLLDELPPEEAVLLFGLLNLEVASEVLDETGSVVRQELVEKVDDERLADLLDELPMDDVVDFLEELPPDTAARLLDLMEPEEAADAHTQHQRAQHCARAPLGRRALGQPPQRRYDQRCCYQWQR